MTNPRQLTAEYFSLSLSLDLQQARRQEMGGVFFKKVENGGVLFVKSGPFLNPGCIMYSISIFLFYIILIRWCVRTQRTPLPRGLVQSLRLSVA